MDPSTPSAPQAAVANAPTPIHTPLMEGYEFQKLSAPLHELVDTIFQLQSRGWLRRHIIELARQVKTCERPERNVCCSYTRLGQVRLALVADR